MRVWASVDGGGFAPFASPTSDRSLWLAVVVFGGRSRARLTHVPPCRGAGDQCQGAEGRAPRPVAGHVVMCSLSAKRLTASGWSCIPPQWWVASLSCCNFAAAQVPGGVKGANTRVAPSCRREGWEDRRPWPSRFSTSRSGPCWAHWFGVVAAWTSRTSSCWSCATSSRSCAARSRGQGFAPLIVPCSRRRPGTCHAPRAARVWSLRGRCCVGIAHLCAGSGDSRPAGADARP